MRTLVRARRAERVVVGLLQRAGTPMCRPPVDQVMACGIDLKDRGSAMADRSGLNQVRELSATMLVVRSPLDKVFIWCDCPCMASAPRSAEDEPLFCNGLRV